MNRRSIFKCLLGAVAASAMEVCGWEGPKPTIEDLWMKEANRLIGEIRKSMSDYRAWKILEDGTFPTGMGDSYLSISISDKSNSN